jgi:GMP synthase (glutamine-hydrolysing)
MKRFLILQLRPLDEAADNEYEAILKYGNLKEEEVHRIRMESESFAGLRANDYAGIIVGGGPSNVSDGESSKPDFQIRFEEELNSLYEQVLSEDIPYLGTCYGLGSFMSFMGAIVSKERYSEKVGYTEVTLAPKADDDCLLKGLPKNFLAFVGHKEACQEVPESAVLLGSSKQCPVQIVRFKENIYATQFHCELDAEGIKARIGYYKNHGYFDPDEADMIIESTRNIITKEAGLILKRFVEQYRQRIDSSMVN